MCVNYNSGTHYYVVSFGVLRSFNKVVCHVLNSFSSFAKDI